MEEQKYFVNRIAQSGIYQFELDPEIKNRPYLVISKDDGYGKDVLAFVITERFTNKDVNLPVYLDGKVSFIRVSGAKEVPKSKIMNSNFSGILRPDVLNIAIRMYMKRFANVNQSQLDNDIDSYLRELENLRAPYYADNNRLFRRKDYLDNSINLNDGSSSIDYNRNNYYSNKNKSYSAKQVKKGYIERQEERILNDWTLDLLSDFEYRAKHNSNRDLQRIYFINRDDVIFMRKQISQLIEKKRKMEEKDSIVIDRTEKGGQTHA